jgi:hypothetical protein
MALLWAACAAATACWFASRSQSRRIDPWLAFALAALAVYVLLTFVWTGSPGT